jgi:hypothetical protein
MIYNYYDSCILYQIISNLISEYNNVFQYKINSLKNTIYFFLSIYIYMMLSAKRGHWEEKYLKYKGKYLALSQQINSIGGADPTKLQKDIFSAKNILAFIKRPSSIPAGSDPAPTLRVNPLANNINLEETFVNPIVDSYNQLPSLFIPESDRQLITNPCAIISRSMDEYVRLGCPINTVYCKNTESCKCLSREEYINFLNYFISDIQIEQDPTTGELKQIKAKDYDRFYEISQLVKTCEYLTLQDPSFIDDDVDILTLEQQINDLKAIHATHPLLKNKEIILKRRRIFEPLKQSLDTTTFSPTSNEYKELEYKVYKASLKSYVLCEALKSPQGPVIHASIRNTEQDSSLPVDKLYDDVVLLFLDNLNDESDYNNLSAPTGLKINGSEDMSIKPASNRFGFYDIQSLEILLNTIIDEINTNLLTSNLDETKLNDLNKAFSGEVGYKLFDKDIPDKKIHFLTLNEDNLKTKFSTFPIPTFNNDQAIKISIDNNITKLPFFYNLRDKIKQLLLKIHMNNHVKKYLEEINQSFKNQELFIRGLTTKVTAQFKAQIPTQLATLSYNYNAFIKKFIIENYYDKLSANISAIKLDNSLSYAWKAIYTKLYRRIKFIINKSYKIVPGKYYYRDDQTGKYKYAIVTNVTYQQNSMKWYEVNRNNKEIDAKGRTEVEAEEAQEEFGGRVDRVSKIDPEWLQGAWIKLDDKKNFTDLMGGAKKNNNNVESDKRRMSHDLHGGAAPAPFNPRREQQKTRTANVQSATNLRKESIVPITQEFKQIKINETSRETVDESKINAYNEKLRRDKETAINQNPNPEVTIELPSFSDPIDTSSFFTNKFPETSKVANISEKLGALNTMLSDKVELETKLAEAKAAITNLQPAILGTTTGADITDYNKIITQNLPIITTKIDELNIITSEIDKLRCDIKEICDQIDIDAPTRAEVFTLQTSVPTTLSAIEDVLRQSDAIKTQLVEAMDRENNLITTDITALSNRIKDGEQTNIIKATTNVDINGIKNIQAVKDFMQSVTGLERSDFIKQAQKIIQSVKTYITVTFTTYLNQNKIETDPITRKLGEITADKTTLQLVQIKTNITNLLEQLNKKMNNRNNAFSQLCMSIPATLADITDATAIVATTLSDAQTKCTLDNTGTGAKIQEYLTKVAAATAGINALERQIDTVQQAIAAAEVEALARLTPGGPAGEVRVGENIVRTSTGATQLTVDQATALSQRLAQDSCVKQFIRIRPFILINDERATALQMAVNKKVRLEYDVKKFRLIQNKTSMITSSHCINFSRLMKPLKVGDMADFLDNEGNQNQKIMTAEILFDGTPEGTPEEQNNILTTINSMYNALDVNNAKADPNTACGLHGFVFNDMQNFMDKNMAAYTNRNTAADPINQRIEYTGFIDKARRTMQNTWEYKASKEMQQEFSKLIDPQLDVFFTEQNKKDVLILFYGSSGSGKTHSTDSLLIKVFSRLDGADYKVSVVSDYNNLLYDYYSTEATAYYNEYDRNNLDQFFINENKLEEVSREDVSPTSPDQNRLKSAAEDKLNEKYSKDFKLKINNSAPKFTEGVSQFASVKYENNRLVKKSIVEAPITDKNKAFKELKNRIKLFRGVNDTGLNDESSRSHLVIQIIHKSGKKLCLVDLAGTEDLNYLLSEESRATIKGIIAAKQSTLDQLNKNRDNFKQMNDYNLYAKAKSTMPSDWKDIPSIFFTKLDPQSAAITLEREIKACKNSFNTEWIRIKKLALKYKYKFKFIENNPGVTIDVLQQKDNDFETSANQEFESLKSKYFDDATTNSMISIMYEETIHIGKSLAGITELLKPENISSPYNFQNRDAVDKRKYTNSEGNYLLLIQFILSYYAKAETNKVLIGALNPRRTDDFNSYNTMKKILPDSTDASGTVTRSKFWSPQCKTREIEC